MYLYLHNKAQICMVLHKITYNCISYTTTQQGSICIVLHKINVVVHHPKQQGSQLIFACALHQRTFFASCVLRRRTFASCVLCWAIMCSRSLLRCFRSWARLCPFTTSFSLELRMNENKSVEMQIYNRKY